MDAALADGETDGTGLETRKFLISGSSSFLKVSNFSQSLSAFSIVSQTLEY